MGLTDFGKAVRKARLDVGETLSTMAAAVGVSPAFLSAMETGRKNVSPEWVKKTEAFFKAKGKVIPNLGEFADVSNKSVSIEGLDPRQQMLIAGFARSSLDAETMEQLAKLLAAAREAKK